MPIVYQHRKKSTNEVFYVGIGKTKDRAYSLHHRSDFWKKVVNKHDYLIEIVKEVPTYRDAQDLEIWMIKGYGRRDLKTGSLVNMTDGGEGSLNKTAIPVHGYKARNKQVENVETGATYSSAKEAAIAEGFHVNTLTQYLNGRRTNKSDLRYIRQNN